MSGHKQLGMGWALAPDGRARHVSTVARGKACQCHCPDCGAPLIARQGVVNRWHFQHVVDSQCAGESALHLAAKQLLLVAASEGRSLFLPGLAGAETAADFAGMLHSAPWVIPARPDALASGRDEVRLDADLIVDALLQVATGEDLVVEIFVTHKKSPADEAKFLATGIDAIEIDLSMLVWDASEVDILHAVLERAPRRWLHNGGRAAVAAKAKAQAEIMASEANARSHRDFIQAIEALVDGKGLLKKQFPWPELSSRANGKNNYGTVKSAFARETPVVTALVGSLRQISPVAFAHDILVNNRAHAQAIFVMGESEHEPVQVAGPELWVTIYPDDGRGDLLERIDAEWHGIDRWQAKLKQRAQTKLASLIGKDNEKKKQNDLFAESFRSLSDDDKLQLIAGRLGVDATNVHSNAVTPWNTTWAVWQALAWHYLLLPRRGHHIDAAAIATDQWLAQLLGWPIDPESVGARTKTAWFWLKTHIEPLGAVRHVSRSTFSVAAELPAGCRPWLRPVMVRAPGSAEPVRHLRPLNRRARRF